MSDRSLLLVHAHPDDETINNGATMAKYVAEGVRVTLVTCTRGEEGEVLIPELAELASSHKDELGTHRETELADAMAALGVTDFRFLGAPDRKWRDSGMMGTEPNNRSDVFWQAGLDDAASYLVKIIREVKPQVLVTYDEFGGYGHPDHIQAHRVAMRAADLAADSNFFGAESADDLPFAKPDELVTTLIDGTPFIDAKMKAMAAHPTQIELDGPFFALSNNLGNQVWGHEYYTLVKGEKSKNLDAKGREADLFA